MPRTPRTRTLFGLAALLGLVGSSTRGDGQDVTHPVASRSDPRLAELRRASAEWDRRMASGRKVIDQVCLVPDVATFYEALAAWDDDRFFPILIDDVDLDLKFLRAFRPTRVVRYPGRGKPIEAGRAWDRAEAAVAAGRSSKGMPGVVVARPESPSLPGLVALAAGRSQPLARLDSPKRFDDVLGVDDLKGFLGALDASVRSVAPNYAGLGDDCDFLTLAGDYPYRYSGPKGSMAVDDRVGRAEPDGRRWAFAGRLLGDPKRSVYAAMCGLFLRPESALLFNGYSETEMPWRAWNLRPAAERLRMLLPTALVAGDAKATVDGWHDVFNPANPSGLVFVNTHGSPTVFNLPGGPAHALDVMPSAPSAVAVIHSFSAADPTNEATIAGRWLAQGTFLYHGAMDEPFLNAFRLPALTSDLLAVGIPFAAALRPLTTEPFGEPWKLVLLGDPLYRLPPRGPSPPRSGDLPALPAWVVYGETDRPATSAAESSRLAWAVNTAIVRRTARAANDSAEDIIGLLLDIDRSRLAPGLRPIRDDLTMVLLFDARRFSDVRALARSIPIAERTPVVARLATSEAVADLHHALDRRDLARAGRPWLDLLRDEIDPEFKKLVTARVASLADKSHKLDEWRALLLAAEPRADRPDAREIIAGELKRVAGPSR